MAIYDIDDKPMMASDGDGPGPSIRQALSNMDKMIGIARESLSGLENHLDPVLLPERSADTEGPTEAKAVPVMSDVLQVMEQQWEMMNSIINKIDNLNRRAQI